MGITQLMQNLSLLAPVAATLGVVTGAIRFPNLSKPSRMLFLYLVLALFTELLTRYLGLIASTKYNLYLFPLFALCEFILFAWLYLYYLMGIKTNYARTIIAGIALLILAGMFTFDNLFDVKHFNSIAKVISNLAIVAIGLLYVWQELRKRKVKSHEFIGFTPYIIAYFSVSMIIFLSVNFLVNVSLTIGFYFWIVYLLLNVSFYIIIAIFLWKHGKTQRFSLFG
jgi:hypothetical protein